jgi:DNA polymerase-3 subunit delta
MAKSAVAAAAPIVLVCGEDDFGVKRRARQLYDEWSAKIGGLDHEIIDASVLNSGEALKALSRLRQALQSLPFFGSGKVIWLKDCNFIGDERAAAAQAVTESLEDLAGELKSFSWSEPCPVRLLISAGKVDKRRVFYKTLDKIGSVEAFAGWSANDKDWVMQAETAASLGFRERGKRISDEALSEFVSRVGPNPRQLENEVEKVSLFAGARAEIELEHVLAVCSRNKTARAFALGDALGDRDLPRLFRCLDEELWEMKLDKQKSEIGLLYGMISKIRALILLKELVREGWIKPTGDFGRFKAQLERVPVDQLPTDKRFNPLSINPYVLFKALPQTSRYSEDELVKAMELLFQCNHRLVSSQLDEALILQQTLARIASPS